MEGEKRPWGVQICKVKGQKWKLQVCHVENVKIDPRGYERSWVNIEMPNKRTKTIIIPRDYERSKVSVTWVVKVKDHHQSNFWSFRALYFLLIHVHLIAINMQMSENMTFSSQLSILFP